MPIIKAAKKDLRSSARRRVFNLRNKRTMADVVKELKTLTGAGKVEEAKKLLPTVYKAIDKAAKRGVIKDNAASRKKSRLSALLKKVVVK